MSKIIGIDLGTTKSCVSVLNEGVPVVITNSEGNRTTPSIVSFLKNGEINVGDAARRQAITNPCNTVMSIKRFMGRRFDEVTVEINQWGYEIVKGDNNTVRINIDGKLYTPQEISAMVLQKMKKTAEDYLRQEVTDAVITVPAYFNDVQRQATKEAGEIAGLNVRRIINEPTAAALAYSSGKENKEKKIAVFDLGGGTFDISVLEVGEGVIEVKSTNGDTHLGGADFDKLIVDWLIEEFKKDEGIDLRKDKTALQRLKECAEKAKIELSSSYETEINLQYIISIGGNFKHLCKHLTRKQFEELSMPTFERCIKICEEAVKKSGMSTSEIDKIIMVGESCRIPKINELVEKFFGKTPNYGVNPVEAVAIGAAIEGEILTGKKKDMLLLDVTSHSLGVETSGGVMSKLIGANTTIPTKKVEIFSTAADNQTSVQIHVLQGERGMASHNKSLGVFNLDGIPPALRGVPQIEVTFDIDANCLLHVTATDKKSGKNQRIRIEAASGLTKAELEIMKLEAKANEATDKAEREKVEKINRADRLIYDSQKLLDKSADKPNGDARIFLENALSELIRLKHDQIYDSVFDLHLKNLKKAYKDACEQD